MTHYLMICSLFLISFTVNKSEKIQGAWQSESGVMIISGNYLSYCEYNSDAFHFTYGGSYNLGKDNVILKYEYNTNDSSKVGQTESFKFNNNGDKFQWGTRKFTRIDDGSPGSLNGPWLFYNRERDGKMGTPRTDSNSRKTLKILSGTRFQWIAYNVETQQFMGTGGGTYTTVGGKYTENIDFFSRNQSRVGASLEFDFERKDNEWHHRGTSSKGDPMYEVWMLRE